ncbi:MAG: hypothetical protein GTN62_10875 [Gemmatimonadales bacterium]|nr:hypothetical protein [Gemmatimonadales bacterium]NIN50598.1 hypothetical protein [Gemmatimonadales bacterium]NIP08062.1 hypothetical protein [Gemmatimonadales bacterium]NIR00644.1 hypothetical protein [Gemmatimonadales bacterium]NIS64888.1 hypothetical protein [Gemmatimonadales bacterium]
MTYELYGYGSRAGALGLTSFRVLDPERGLVGLVFNIIAFVLIWRWWEGWGKGQIG